MLIFTLRRLHSNPPAPPFLPSGASIFSSLVSVSGVAGSEATRDTRHPTLHRNWRPDTARPEACQPLGSALRLGAGQVARVSFSNPFTSGLMVERSAEKIREALRGSGRPSRSRKGFESGKLYSGTRRWPPEGLSVALRGGRWPIDTCYPQSNDAALWLCSVASQTPEPNS